MAKRAGDTVFAAVGKSTKEGNAGGGGGGLFRQRCKQLICTDDKSGTGGNISTLFAAQKE